MKELLMNIFLICPVLFGIISIIQGHRNYRKAKNMTGPNQKGFITMQVVAWFHAASGYLIVAFYVLIVVLYLK